MPTESRSRASLSPKGLIRAEAHSARTLYYVGSRSQHVIHKIDLVAERDYGLAVSLAEVAYPRGFAVLGDGRFVVGSGTHPVHGGGRRALLLYDRDGGAQNDDFIVDALLDPLDVAVRHDDLYVTSEFPFGASDAKASLRR